MLNGKHRRNHFQIMKDGLYGLNKTGNKTSFMFLAEISFSMLKEYFPEALNNGLIEKNGKKYVVTKKGWEFIATIEKAETLLGKTNGK